jgi:hypothetical protein
VSVASDGSIYACGDIGGTGTFNFGNNVTLPVLIVIIISYLLNTAALEMHNGQEQYLLVMQYQHYIVFQLLRTDLFILQV